MDQRFVSLSFLFAVVVVSGCTGGGGGQVDDQGDTAISIDELEVTPTEIFEGSNVRVRMSVTNTGQLPAKLLVGEGDENEGSQILTNHCPDIFDVESFSASSSNVSETRKVYTLAPEYQVQLNWNLNQDSENVPLNGYDCPLKFEVPFNYSVEAFKQLQVKRNDAVEGTEELFAKSSRGPMKIEIETIGSSSERGAPTFLENDGAEVLIQLENKKPEESSYTGTLELGTPEITARGVQFAKTGEESSGERICPRPDEVPENGKLQIYEGQTKVFRCDLNWSLDTPSMRAEIFARSNYTYVKSVGTRNVKVRYRGE